VDPLRRARIEALLDGALDVPPDHREAWLREACAGDDALRRQVADLLAAHERPGGLLDRGLALEAAMLVERARPPRPIGPYRILEEIGRGGMSVVYRAERSDGHFRRRVALKVLRGELDAEELHARLAAERQILASLDHPNIARLLDGGITEDGRPYLVMEHVLGRSLTVHCDRERLPVEERLRLFLEVAGAVQHAHARLVVHRDLKPSNILVTPEGQVRLLDFGIAKVLDLHRMELEDQALPVTRAGTRLFTPEYASPEQLRGESGSVANDIWALGVVLYELLCGTRPFEGAHGPDGDLERKILESDPVPPSVRIRHGDPDRAAARGGTPRALARRLSGDLDRIVAMALRKEPRRRYASVEQLAGDVTAFLSGHPVRARPDGALYRTGKLLRRHRVEAVAAALILLSIVAGTGTALWQAREARAERDRAELAARGSEAVAGYLLDLFRTADPWEVPADRLTARQLLARGESRLETLPADPLLRARVLLAMGETYRVLGDAIAGRPLLERALEIRRRELGELHPATGEALLALADLLRREGKMAEAETLALQALRASRGGDGPSGREPDVEGEAAALTLLGFIHTGMGRLPDALSDFEGSLELLRRSGAGASEAAGHALVNVAAVHRRLQHLPEAEAFLREAMDHRARNLGPEHPLTAVAMARLGGLLAEHLGRDEEAAKLFEEALDIQTRVLGVDHPTRVEPLSGLAHVRERQGDRAGAEALLRETHRTHRAGLGEDHPSTLASAEELALFLARQGRVHTADSILGETLPARRAILGPTHPALATSLANRGRVLLALDRLDEAEAAFREALEIREGVFGSEHPLFGLALVDLSDVDAARGDWAARRTLLERGLEILERFHAPGHPETLMIRELLAEARRRSPAEASARRRPPT
jgi:eukaryotic-like serine/threonine-protein kinase